MASELRLAEAVVHDVRMATKPTLAKGVSGMPPWVHEKAFSIIEADRAAVRADVVGEIARWLEAGAVTDRDYDLADAIRERFGGKGGDQ